MNFPEMEAVFDEYLPLRAYLPQVPAEGVSRYADCALQEILPLVEPPPADAKSVVVVSHAVYVSILAAAIATAAGFSEAEQAVLFESNVGEVSGFRISLRPRQITYVGETL
jgi:rhodanese-related sulfurtransferase